MKVIDWIIGNSREEGLGNYLLCCLFQPLQAIVVFDAVISWFDLKMITNAGNHVGFKHLYQKLIPSAEHIDSFVDLLAIKKLSDIAQWSRKIWCTPEYLADYSQAFPEEMKISC